jgi:hypothetical protein
MIESSARRILLTAFLLVPLGCGSSGSPGTSGTGGASGGSGGATGGSSGGSGGATGGSTGGSGPIDAASNPDAAPAADAAPADTAVASEGGPPADGGTGSDASDATATIDAPPGTSAAPEYQNDAQFCQALGLNCGGDTLKDKAGAYHTVWCGSCMGDTVCAATPTPAGGAAGTCSTAVVGLNAAEKKLAEQLTSVWENDSVTVDYAYSEDIMDMRGFTNGRAGFCTGTGDAIVVIACYDSVKPGNSMQHYFTSLQAIEDKFIKAGFEKQPDETGLGGWVAAWGTAAKDAPFRGCQDSVVDAAYYGLAMQHVAALKLKTALTKASLYDAQINQGEYDPGTGVKDMIKAASDMTGPMSDPPTMDDEDKWLGNFHKVRAKVMYDGTKDDPLTWRDNMYRIAHYEKFRRDKNFGLTGCLKTGQVAASAYFSPATNDKGTAHNVGTCP